MLEKLIPQPSSGAASTGGAEYTFAAVAYQMITNELSEASVQAGWELSDTWGAFPQLVKSLTKADVDIVQTTSALALDDATDSAALIGSSLMRDYITNSTYLLDLAKGSSAFSNYFSFRSIILSTVTYASKSLSVAAQEGTTRGLCFGNAGAAAYIVGDVNETIYQYTLATPWDVSTGTYASKSLSVTSQDGSPRSLLFNSDGTKLYLVGTSTDSVYQYTLSVAWDVSTATYTASKSVTAQSTNPIGIAISIDGSKMYILDSSTKVVYQYTLSVAWDVSTASYDSISLSVNSQDTSPQGIEISSDGLSLFYLGNSGIKAYRYALPTAFILTGATYASDFFSFSSQETSPRAMAISRDGSKLFVVGTANDTIYQYSGTPFGDGVLLTSAS